MKQTNTYSKINRKYLYVFEDNDKIKKKHPDINRVAIDTTSIVRQEPGQNVCLLDIKTVVTFFWSNIQVTEDGYSFVTKTHTLSTFEHPWTLSEPENIQQMIKQKLESFEGLSIEQAWSLQSYMDEQTRAPSFWKQDAIDKACKKLKL